MPNFLPLFKRAYFPPYRFLDDIEFMIGTRPSWYWIITWKYVGPAVVLLLLVASFVDMGRKPVLYTAWDKNEVS